MGEIKLYLTYHAKQKMTECGINTELVKKAITQGSKFKQAEGYLAIYAQIAVAYKIIGENTYKIKTVFIRT